MELRQRPAMECAYEIAALQATAFGWRRGPIFSSPNHADKYLSGGADVGRHRRESGLPEPKVFTDDHVWTIPVSR